MQILVHPHYSRRELNADSCYVLLSALIPAILRQRPRWQFLYIFPDASQGHKYISDGFFHDPRILRVAQRVPRRRMSAGCNFDSCWHDGLHRRYGFDLIWNHLPEIAYQMRFAGRVTATGAEHQRPQIATQHHFVMHRSLGSNFYEHLALLELMGSLGSERNILHSEYCRQMLFENAGAYLTPEHAARITSSAIDIPLGTIEPELRRTGWPDNEVPVIAWNHRLQHYKGYRETFAALDTLWRKGVRFRLRYMSDSHKGTSEIRRLPFVDICYCATRREYLAALRGCDLNVLHSRYETFCVGAVESMALGQPVIAPAGLTFPEITDQRELSYPYLFERAADAPAMIEKLLIDHAERRRWGELLADSVHRRYAQDLAATRYVDLFEQLAAIDVRAAPAILEGVGKLLPAFYGKPLPDLYRAACGQWMGTTRPITTGTTTLTRFLRIIRALGADVKLEGIEQLICRAEEEGKKEDGEARTEAQACGDAGARRESIEAPAAAACA